MKKECLGFKKWIENKGNLFSFVYYEFNMIDVNTNIWQIDSGSTIYITNFLQGMKNLKKTM